MVACSWVASFWKSTEIDQALPHAQNSQKFFGTNGPVLRRSVRDPIVPAGSHQLAQPAGLWRQRALYDEHPCRCIDCTEFGMRSSA